jgi:hypothetical protein
MSYLGHDTGMGTTLTPGTDSTFLPELTSLSHNGESIEEIETSHLGTTSYKTYIPADLKEGGEIQVEGRYLGSFQPSIGTVQTWTIDWGGTGAGYKTTFSGFWKSFEPKAEVGANLMTFSAVIKITGAVTHAAS